uniref:Rec21/ENK19 domain-containing protein n=1 Tax=Sciurus vulgaris TaxID=55149 RepID=A0A8D2DC63_SCIVU
MSRKRCKKNRQAMTGTLISSPPTWGQIKNLTNKAENVIESQGVPVTPATVFMAMLAVVSCQMPCLVLRYRPTGSSRTS